MLLLYDEIESILIQSSRLAPNIKPAELTNV